MTPDGIIQWEVEVNEPQDAVRIQFLDIELNGIETFITALLPQDAIKLAMAILETAKEISS